MNKYMSDEEFRKCNSVDRRKISNIYEELDNKGINDISERIDYVKKNYEGQIYLNFMLEELDNKILMNYHTVPEEYSFSLGAVDGLLRSYLFASEYMQEGLPEHAYDYIKSKSGTFVNELENQLKYIK